MALIKLTLKQKLVIISITTLIALWPLFERSHERNLENAAEAAELKKTYLNAYSSANAFLVRPDASKLNSAYPQLLQLKYLIDVYHSKESLDPDYNDRLEKVQQKIGELEASVNKDGCNSACVSARERLKKVSDLIVSLQGDLDMIPTQNVITMQVACNGLISNNDLPNGEAENVYRCGNLAPDSFGSQLAIETTSRALGRLNAMASAPQGALRLFPMGDKMYSYTVNTPEGPRIIQDVFPAYNLVLSSEPIKRQIAEKKAEIPLLQNELNAAKLQTFPVLLSKTKVIVRELVELMNNPKSPD